MQTVTTNNIVPSIAGGTIRILARPILSLIAITFSLATLAVIPTANAGNASPTFGSAVPSTQKSSNFGSTVNSNHPASVRSPAVKTGTKSTGNLLKPDLVITCASVYLDPDVDPEHNWMSLGLGGSMVLSPYIAAVTVKNIGFGTSQTLLDKPDLGTFSILEIVPINHDLTGHGGGGVTPPFGKPYGSYAPGRSFTTSVLLSGRYDLNKPYYWLKSKAKFYFKIEIDPYLYKSVLPASEVNSAIKAADSNMSNNTFGPVTVSRENTCGKPQITVNKAKPQMRRSNGYHPPLKTKSQISTQHGLKPLTSKPASSALRKPIVQHKIGLAPRVQHAAGLPAGWRETGGMLRAQRAGLKLHLSGGRILASRRSHNGGLEYVLQDATGRVVKRMRPNQTVRLQDGTTLTLR